MSASRVCWGKGEPAGHALAARPVLSRQITAQNHRQNQPITSKRADRSNSRGHSSRSSEYFTPRRNVFGFDPLAVRSFNVEDRDAPLLPENPTCHSQSDVLRIVLVRPLHRRGAAFVSGGRVLFHGVHPRRTLL